MKKIVATLFCSLFFLLAFGQNAEQDAQMLVQTYGLDAAQSKKALQIMELKYKNLSEIQPLREGQPDIFYSKWYNVYEGANASIRMMLREEQAIIFQEKQTELRLLRAKRMGEMKESGMTDIKAMERILLEEGLY